MKKMVSAAVCAVMLGWTGVASANDFLDTTVGSPTALSASNSPSNVLYEYDFSTTFSVADVVDWAEVAIMLSDISVNGVLLDNENVIITINGVPVFEGYVSDITDSYSAPGYNTFKYDATTELDNSSLLKVGVVAQAGSFNVGGVAVYGEYTPVPEPTTMLLFGAGIAGLAAFSRRREPRVELA